MTPTLFDKLFPLIGVLIGGVLTYGSVFMNFRYGRKQKILERQFLAYEEITKTIIDIKLIIEENIGSIAKLQIALTLNKMSKEEVIEKFNPLFDKISLAYDDFYKLYAFSFVLDKELNQLLIDLHHLMSEALNPAEFILNARLDVMSAKFEEVLSIMSAKAGVNRPGVRLNIPNPHRWVNLLFPEKEEIKESDNKQ